MENDLCSLLSEAKFDENNKPQVTDFNLSNTEWQFEVDC